MSAIQGGILTIPGKVVVLTFACAVLSPAQDLSSLKISQAKIDLMAGRLTISGPPEAITSARPHDIMSAPASSQQETRIMINQGPKRVALIATELFARTRTGVDFATAAKLELSHAPTKVAITLRVSSSSLPTVEYLPQKSTTDQEANMIMGVLVAQPDGSVVSLIWYANPEAALDGKGALALARSMADTIAFGGRNLDFSPGERRFCGYSNNQDVFVTLPAGYVITEQRGVDFTVQYAKKILPLGDGDAIKGSYPAMGLYLGNYPSNGGSANSGANGTATIFGQQIFWSQRSSKSKGKTIIAARALVKLTKDEARPDSATRYADVFMNAGDASTIQELKSIASTLRIGVGRREP